MVQYIDKDALVAEIKRYKHKADERLKIKGRTLAEDLKDSALQNLCGNLIYFLDTIEVKEVQEEPVSDDWEEAAFDYAEACKYDGGEKLLCVEHFKAGAKWQREQFEKNRLAHCDALTKEQAQIESDFVVDFIKKNNRTPTFIDAIEYGVKLKLKDGNNYDKSSIQ